MRQDWVSRVCLTANLDAAIWAAELSEGNEPARVYSVRASDALEDTTQDPDYVPASYPEMTLRTSRPLQVIKEVTEWNHYPGTRAQLRPGDMMRLVTSRISGRLHGRQISSTLLEHSTRPFGERSSLLARVARPGAFPVDGHGAWGTRPVPAAIERKSAC